ncbi:hypothetical protein L218DRAFT_405457 [Marasmius fiardii PR-910]|nr:hypothetical protein L218DRAFT_405457 [Marasmius fiardii PR-910]
MEQQGNCLQENPLSPYVHVFYRFCLREGQHYIEVGSQMQDCAWLSQSFSVFHALNIQLNEDLSEYKLIIPYFGLRGRLQRSAQKRQRRQLFAPIYFFVKPCPSPGARFYFWSHDPFGQIPLSRSGCKYLGLPFKLSLKVQYYLESWPTRIYKFLHDYQIERGYDPRTTDFAQSHGYPTWEVTPSENRFQEVDQELHTNISKSESLPSPRIEHVQGHSESEVNVGLPHSRDTSNVRVEASTSLISDSTSSLNPAKFAANPASTQSGEHRSDAYHCCLSHFRVFKACHFKWAQCNRSWVHCFPHSHCQLSRIQASQHR